MTALHYTLNKYLPLHDEIYFISYFAYICIFKPEVKFMWVMKVCMRIFTLIYIKVKKNLSHSLVA